MVMKLGTEGSDEHKATGDAPVHETLATTELPTTNATLSPMIMQAQQDCKLLSLPPEIRNRIYRYAVVEAMYVKVIVPSSTAKRDYNFQSPLTRACRQIRSECLEMFYELNEFFVHYKHDSAQSISPLIQHLDKVKVVAILANCATAFVLDLLEDIDRYKPRIKAAGQSFELGGERFEGGELECFRHFVLMRITSTLLGSSAASQASPSLVLEVRETIQECLREVQKYGRY